MTAAPATARRLIGTGWTSTASIDGRRHWVVVAVRGDAAELRSVLAPVVTHVLPWRALRDRGGWWPGWRALPPTE